MTSFVSRLLRLASHGQEEFELGGQLVLRVQSVRKVDTPYSAVRVNLDPQRFDIISSVGPSREIGQVELNLIPSLVKAHGHGANEWFDPRGALVIGGAESPPNVLVV